MYGSVSRLLLFYSSLSILILIPHLLGYYNFIIKLKIGIVNPSLLLFIFRAFLGSLYFHMKLVNFYPKSLQEF